MRSSRILFILIGSLLISQAVFAQASTAEIRAIWNQEIFVLINISTEDVNVSNLSFSSSNGEILPENWRMFASDNASMPYSLAEFEPGSCLLAYLSGTAPELPANVDCSRTVGEFTLTNANDIVWDISQRGFSAEVDDAIVAECDMNGTSCNLTVSTTFADPDDATMSMMDTDTADIRALWNQDVLVLVNNSTEDVNISNLSFSSTNGEILPENWMMNTAEDDNLPYSLGLFQPGSCLVAYLSSTSPELPEDVECGQTVGEFTLTNGDDLVWDVAQGGFSANITGASVADCNISGSSCDITVATTLANPIDALTGEHVGTDIRVVWEQDILVLINNSSKDVDLSGVSFSNDTGAILPANWVMNTTEGDNIPYTLSLVEPGSCLLAYLSGTDPDIPENVDCTRVIGEFTLVNPGDIVWDASQGGFDAVLNGSIAAECDITRSSCAIPLTFGE